jgi:hypothetical protein
LKRRTRLSKKRRWLRRKENEMSKDDPQTYSESARGIKITAERVIKEFKNHGQGPSDWAEFFGKKGPRPGAVYSASKALKFLGYSVGDNPLLSRESANRAMDAASREMESPAIRKARVKPIRRSGI